MGVASPILQDVGRLIRACERTRPNGVSSAASRKDDNMSNKRQQAVEEGASFRAEVLILNERHVFARYLPPR